MGSNVIGLPVSSIVQLLSFTLMLKKYKKLNDFDFYKALSTLIKLSIFEQENSKNDTFNIHELFQEFIRNSLSKEERETYLKKATHLMSSYLPACYIRLPENPPCVKLQTSYQIPLPLKKDAFLLKLENKRIPSSFEKKVSKEKRIDSITLEIHWKKECGEDFRLF